MSGVRRRSQYTIAQLAAAIAGLAVILAIARTSALLALFIISGLLYVMQRARPPRRSFVGPAACVGALIGLVRGAILAATFNESCGLILFAAPALVLPYAIIGVVLGQVITFVVSFGQQPAPKQKPRRESPDPTKLRRKRLLTDYATVEDLISQAQNDGDNELLTKLTAHRAKLKGDLGL